MEILKPVKQTTWRTRLLEMEPGQSVNIDIKSCAGVSAKISLIKSTNPDKNWNWTLKKIKVDGKHHHGQVTRIS